MIDKIKNIIRTESFIKLIKFSITGVSNTIVDFCVFLFFCNLIGISKYSSQIIGYSAGILNSYIINRNWTFKSNKGFISIQLIKFVVSNGLMLLLSLGLIWVFSDCLGIMTIIAKIIATFITLIINFVISKFWVFKST